jgi:hypothetical protein
MGNTGEQLAQNCLDHPGIGITGVRITDGQLYFPHTPGSLETAVHETHSHTYKKKEKAEMARDAMYVFRRVRVTTDAIKMQ